MAVSKGDLTLQRAIEVTATGDEGVDRLLAMTDGSRGVLHQARGRCLAALQGRPADRHALLRALELIDHALDRLEAGQGERDGVGADLRSPA